MNNLLPSTTAASDLATVPGPASPPDIVAAWLAGREPTTLAAYQQSLADFAAWLQVTTADAAARLLSNGAGAANGLALAYRVAMTDRDLKPSTIAVRLSALRSLVKVARLTGVVNWDLEVPMPRVKAYRDTRGPGLASVAGIVTAAANRDDAKGKRDLAIIRLLYDVALRRAEVVSLDVEHFDPENRRLSVKGKGDNGRVWITLPDATAQAVHDWISERGDAPGPLFVELATGKKLRLSGTSVGRIVTKAGNALGVKARPHGLRHTAITAALDATGGDVRTVARFSRHAKIDTVLKYDDNRIDLAGSVASLVAAAVNQQAQQDNGSR